MGGLDSPPICFDGKYRKYSARKTKQMIALQVKKREGKVSSGELLRFAALAHLAAKLKGDVGLVITGNEEMCELNRCFRHMDKPTDVLSFPSANDIADYAGDLAISVEIAAENARIFGHSTTEEIKVLILHGMLHLAGYDHESDDGAMARKELALRKSLGLPDSLIKRTGQHAISISAVKANGKTTTPSSAKAHGKKPRGKALTAKTLSGKTKRK